MVYCIALHKNCPQHFCLFIVILAFLNFLFLILFILLRDVHTCGPLISVERVEMWKKVGKRSISILPSFFNPVSAVGEWKVTSCCQTILAPRDRELSFDDTLETVKWGRMFPGCYLSGFGRSETLALLHWA